MTNVITRRPSARALPSESELQTDEIRLKAERTLVKGQPAGVVLSDEEKRKRRWILYLVGFMDLFGVSMMISLLPKCARNLGASPFLAGLIGSLYGAVQMFSSPVMGKLSDLYGRKNILLISYIGPAVGYAAIGLTGSLLVLTLARVPTGIMKHGLSVSKAYLIDISDSSERQAVLGLFNACSSLGFIFGPLTGGYLADLDPTLSASFLATASVFVVNFCLVALLVPSLNINRSSSNGTSKISSNLHIQQNTGSISYYLKQLVSSVNIFKGIHWWVISDLIFLRFLLTFSTLIFRKNFPIFLDEHFGVGYKTLGQIFSFKGIAATIAAATCGYISKQYSDHSKQITHFALLMAVSIFLITVSPTVSLLLAFLIPLTVATSNLRICMLAVMLERGRADEKGAIIGLGNSISSFSRMLAPIIVGLTQEYSTEATGYLSFILALMATAISLYL